MSLKERLEQMRKFVVSKLDETGEFSFIDPEHVFSSKTIDDSINNKPEEHMFVIKKPEFREKGETGEHLIVMYPHEKLNEKPTKEEFASKLIAASNAGIFTIPLIYKFKNNEGLYWRRKTLSHEKPWEGYKEAPAWIKRSLKDLPRKVRNRLRVLSTILERRWVPDISYGSPVYYQSKSEKRPNLFEEQLMRFRFKPVFPDYSDSDVPRGLVKEIYAKTVDPVIADSMDLFTVRPMRRVYHGPEHMYLHCKNLLGDFLALPNVKTSADDERAIQYKLGVLKHVIKEASINQFPWLYQDSIENIIERLGIMMDSSKSEGAMNPLSEAMDILIKNYSNELNKIFGTEGYKSHKKIKPIKKTIKEEPPWKIYSEYYLSESEPGTTHETQLMILTEPPMEYLHRCDCKGFRYWHKCWHIEDIIAKSDILTKFDMQSMNPPLVENFLS